MALSSDINLFFKEEEIFARALSNPKGLEVSYENPRAAVRACQRFNHYRVLLRKQSLTIYPEGDPRRGACIYDHIVLRRPKDTPNKLVFSPEVIIPTEIKEL